MAFDETAVPIGDFATDFQVRPDPDVSGRFTGEITEAWRIFYAFGGASMAMALRAAQVQLGRDDLHPVSTTATFAAPVPCGPVVVDTSILRNGNTGAQVTADLSSSSGETVDLHLSAVFGADRDTHVS